MRLDAVREHDRLELGERTSLALELERADARYEIARRAYRVTTIHRLEEGNR